jgi:hypothetical protein
MYTPIGGYWDDYLVPASFVDESLTEMQRKILKFSTSSPNPVLLSGEREYRNVKKKGIRSFIKKQLIKILV